MKVLFPQHIKKGIFTGFTINILWFSISMIQMFLMAIGVVIALATFSSFSKANAKNLGIIVAVLILMVFAFITFFKVSEMNLLAFIAKKIKDIFLDTTKKYQTNSKKEHPIDLLIAKSHQKETKQKIEIKSWIDPDQLNKLSKGGLI